ncbi:hypothetical protein MFRU_008g00160 [Monilinia fructicola]|nr:hypothetical protein MFRU_008g00160 [Monilinia fructicola]
MLVTVSKSPIPYSTEEDIATSSELEQYLRIEKVTGKENSAIRKTRLSASIKKKPHISDNAHSVWFIQVTCLYPGICQFPTMSAALFTLLLVDVGIEYQSKLHLDKGKTKHAIIHVKGIVKGVGTIEV